LKQVAEHTTDVINALDKKPALMGQPHGGIRSACRPGPYDGGRTSSRHVHDSRTVAATSPLGLRWIADRRYGWANALDEKEAKELHDAFHVACSGIALVQMGNANLNPWTQAKVNTKNPDRGPLLIIDGEKDHTVPWAIANAAYKRQRRNRAVTEIVKIPNRGHSLTIDHGWREVAQTALDFLKRFA
jgi:non-heme chloroperoxidase